MKTIIYLSLLVSAVTFSHQLQATKKSARKPNQVNADVIQFRVEYGDKISQFVMSKAKSGAALVEFANSEGRRGTRSIRASDYEYFREQIASLTGPTNSKEFCHRRFVEVSTGGRNMVGCLGAGNKVAVELQNLANLLALMF